MNVRGGGYATAAWASEAAYCGEEGGGALHLDRLLLVDGGHWGELAVVVIEAARWLEGATLEVEASCL
ncbi:hypothetical protein N9151_00475 [bacterium]|nr:hypothetical protein [bacterium]